MGFENITVQQSYTPQNWESDTGGENDKQAPEVKQNPLDSEQAQQILNQLDQWYENTRIIQSPNRLEQSIDEDFYDGLQWTDEDRLELENRGQAALVFNEIKPAIDWIIGTERRARIEGTVRPRKDSDVEEAAAKDKVMKYSNDVNRTRFNRSFAFSQAIKAGVGWLEDGAQDPIYGDLPIYSRSESWRNIWYDQLARERDLSDARFMFRDRWVDVDIAVAKFPERKAILEARAEHNYLSPTDEDEFYQNTALYYNVDSQGRYIGRSSVVDDMVGTIQNRRPRVRMTEAWFRLPKNIKVFHTDRYAIYNNTHLNQLDHHIGQEYDPNNPIMRQAVDSGIGQLSEATRMVMHVAIFVKGFLVYLQRSPYRHNQFPFTPVWGYRRARDGMPYGPIRNARDPQEDLNKRRSKALHILSTNQVIMDEGAVEDEEEMRDEVADPAGVIKKKPGMAFEINRDNQLAEEHIMLETKDGDYIRSASGVTGENLGRETNAKSGIAIERKQSQGSMVTVELFDNLLYATQIQGEKQLSLIEQYIDYPMVVALTDARNNASFLPVNHPSPDGTHIMNDITRSKADYIISMTDWRESVRIAMFEQLMEMVSKLPPEVALNLLDLVFEFADIEGKDAIVARIRMINGMTDPNRKMTPEELQQRQQQQAVQQQQQQLAMQTQIADLQQRLANIRKTQSDANNTHLQSMEQALKLVDTMKGDPLLAPAADTLLQHLQQQTGDYLDEQNA